MVGTVSRDAHCRATELENQLMVAKLMARHLWTVLAARIDQATAVLFADGVSADARRVIDVAFDAAEIVWERHRILVEPCRRVLDQRVVGVLVPIPAQAEMYLARYPGGEVRNVTRDQLLMMAGMDVAS